LSSTFLLAQNISQQGFNYGEPIRAPEHALSWYKDGDLDDLSQKWEEVVSAVAQFGPEKALQGYPRDRVIYNQALHAEISPLFFELVPHLQKSLQEMLAKNDDLKCTNGQDWELQLRIHAGLFPAAYVVSKTCSMVFQLPLSQYKGIFDRLEKAGNFYLFGTITNPEQQVNYFDSEGKKIPDVGTDFDDFCPPPLVLWTWTSANCDQDPRCYYPLYFWRQVTDTCSDGTTRVVDGCFFMLYGCPG
jgi:hypothetical protein